MVLVRFQVLRLIISIHTGGLNVAAKSKSKSVGQRRHRRRLAYASTCMNHEKSDSQVLISMVLR